MPRPRSCPWAAHIAAATHSGSHVYLGMPDRDRVPHMSRRGTADLCAVRTIPCGPRSPRCLCCQRVASSRHHSQACHACVPQPSPRWPPVPRRVGMWLRGASGGPGVTHACSPQPCSLPRNSAARHTAAPRSQLLWTHCNCTPRSLASQLSPNRASGHPLDEATQPPSLSRPAVLPTPTSPGFLG